MNLVNALILGVVEGITEFLPVSSTAHLIFASKFLKIPQTEFQKFFEVFIQSGAILAVIFLYFKYAMKHQRIIKSILISFIPTAIIGLLFYKIIKGIFFESYLLIGGALGLIGLVFIIVEKLIKKNKIKLSKKLTKVNTMEVIVIGLAQSLAIVPGVSRAGIVILAMLILGYEREEAAVYSFLLAVPTLLAASALDLLKSKDALFAAKINLSYLTIGFLVSFVTAYFSVKWLINYLKTNTLTPFGIYRITLAIILLLG